MSSNFTYLSEKDMIAAGVLDMPKCINACEEVLTLLTKGDYLMGGPSNNSHGMYVVFPEKTEFPNMPVAGPDRRFVTMPAYLGGRFDVCGNKWYGSNAENKKKGLPRSVLMLTLNNKDTGEPIAFMSDNLLSAVRTGAVPGVGARYLARKDTKVLTMVGCGPIGKSCFDGLVGELPQLRLVLCNNHSEANAVKMTEYIKATYGIEAKVENNLEKAIREADAISIAVSRTAPLMIKNEWVKKGATLFASGPLQCDEELWLRLHVVYDHIGLHKAYMSEAIESGNKDKYYGGVIGGPIYRLIDAGKKPSLDDSDSIGQIILGEKKGRGNDDECMIFVACGMAVFDIGFGLDLLHTAKEKGIGTTLELWDKPAQA